MRRNGPGVGAVRVGPCAENCANPLLANVLISQSMEITPEQAYKHLDKFKPFYDAAKRHRSTEVPDDTRITVWVEDKEGFMINDFVGELGPNALIATSWIEHEELVKLCGH